MKRLLIICLATVLIFTGSQVNVFAQTTLERQLEESILRVKDLFDILDTYDTFNSSISSGSNISYFYMNWSDSNLKLDNINVTTDSDRNLINYNRYSPVYRERESKEIKFSKEEALDIGLKFIEEVDKDIYNEIELVEDKTPLNSFDSDYMFTFTRVVNDIPYRDNIVNVSVSKYTGQVSGYNTMWDRNLLFPKADGILSIDKAKESYIYNIGLELIYKRANNYHGPMGNDDTTIYYLVYSPLRNNQAIDAFSGEVVDYSYYGPYYGSDKGEGGSAEENSAITPEEREEIKKVSGILDVEDAESEARKVLNIDSEYILKSKNLYSDYFNPNDYFWTLYFEKKIDNKIWNINIALNAKTLEIASFNRYENFNAGENPSIAGDKALEIANSFIKLLQPEKIEEIELINQGLQEEQGSYYFNFIRKTDDAYVDSDYISVTVDSLDGEIDSYALQWHKGELPAKGQVIGLDKAYDLLFNRIGYKLSYTTIYDYDKPEGENKEIKLVYALDNQIPANIDAHSGEILDYTGKLYKESEYFQYVDISDSYTKEKIETLALYGVGFNSNEFKPREKIKQRDFVYLLFRSLNSYRLETEEDIETIYKELINSGIVKAEEKFPERLVTKEEAVKYVIRAKNYSNVAEIEGIYAHIFEDSKDISSGLEGYMNIAYGLGIINAGGTNRINPKAQLSREDSASIIYNYMFK